MDRRLRQPRQDARVRVRLLGDCALLAAHHASHAPRPGPDVASLRLEVDQLRAELLVLSGALSALQRMVSRTMTESPDELRPSGEPVLTERAADGDVRAAQVRSVSLWPAAVFALATAPQASSRISSARSGAVRLFCSDLVLGLSQSHRRRSRSPACFESGATLLLQDGTLTDKNGICVFRLSESDCNADYCNQATSSRLPSARRWRQGRRRISMSVPRC